MALPCPKKASVQLKQRLPQLCEQDIERACAIPPLLASRPVGLRLGKCLLRSPEPRSELLGEPSVAVAVLPKAWTISQAAVESAPSIFCRSAYATEGEFEAL